MVTEFLGTSDDVFAELFRRGAFNPLQEAVESVLRDQSVDHDSISFLTMITFAKTRRLVLRGQERPLTNSQLTSLVKRVASTVIRPVDCVGKFSS